MTTLLAVLVLLAIATIQVLDIAMPEAMRLVKRLGIGSSEVLRSVRLSKRGSAAA